MKIKRFLAPDMRSALAKVKEELGPDAVIMSNKKVAEGVEIVAAYEEDAAPPPPPERPSRKAPLRSDFGDDDNVTISSRAAAAARASAAEPSLGGYERTLSSRSRASRNNEQMANTLSELLSRQKSRRGAAPSAAGAPAEGDYPRTLAEQHGELSPEGGRSEGAAPSRRAPAAGPDPAIAALQEEVQSIRKLLQSQLAGLMTDDMERREPVKAMVVKLLVRGGFTDSYARFLAEQLPPSGSLRQSWRALAAVIAENLLIGRDEILQRGGAVTLVGPTGVGKTTTIAKLAAHFAMQYGADQVALVTADNYRIGAYEQLQTYGRIMGCTVKSLTDMAEMQNVLYQLRNRRLVLIDTAGMGQRDGRLTAQLDQLVNSSNIHIHNYLVLPATGQRRVLQEAFEQFSRIELSGAILTKLDESIGLGDVLGVCMSNRLPVCYTTNGQRVPEDLEVAKGSKLVQLAMAYMEDDRNA